MQRVVDTCGGPCRMRFSEYARVNGCISQDVISCYLSIRILIT